MRAPFTPAELLTGPFTAAQAAAAGVTRGMLEGDAWRRMFRDVYIHTSVVIDERMRAAAVGLVAPREVFLWRRAAAWINGVDVRRDRDVLEVACHNRRRVRVRPGWQVSEVTIDPGDLEIVAGITVTGPTRTAYDCARFLPVWQAVAVTDHLLRQERTTVEQIENCAAKQFHVRHKRRVPSILALVDGRAESPPESHLRVLMVGEGWCPQPQYVVLDGNRFVARVDLAFPDLKIAVEYDGEWHSSRMSADEERRARLEALGWVVIKVYAEDLRSPEARAKLMARIREIRDARRRVLSR